MANTYRVLTSFIDKEDSNKEYQAGDLYKPSKRIAKARYDSLSTNRNALGRPVLALVDGDGVEEKEEEKTTETKTTAKK